MSRKRRSMKGRKPEEQAQPKQTPEPGTRKRKMEESLLLLPPSSPRLDAEIVDVIAPGETQQAENQPITPQLTEEALRRYLAVHSVKDFKKSNRSKADTSEKSAPSSNSRASRLEWQPPEIETEEQLQQEVRNAVQRVASHYPNRKLLGDSRILINEAGSSLSASDIKPSEIMPQLVSDDGAFQRSDFDFFIQNLCGLVDLSVDQLESIVAAIKSAPNGLWEQIHQRFDRIRVVQSEDDINIAIDRILESIICFVAPDAEALLPKSRKPYAVAGAFAYSDRVGGKYVPDSYYVGKVDRVHLSQDGPELESPFVVIETKVDNDDLTNGPDETVERVPILEKPWLKLGSCLAEIICYLVGAISARLGIVLTNKGFIAKLKEEVNLEDVDDPDKVIEDGDFLFKYYILSNNGLFLKINSLVANPSEEERIEILENREKLLKLLLIGRFKGFDTSSLLKLKEKFPVISHTGSVSSATRREGSLTRNANPGSNQQMNSRTNRVGDLRNPETETGFKRVYQVIIGSNNRPKIRLASVLNFPILADGNSSVGDRESVSSFDG